MSAPSPILTATFHRTASQGAGMGARTSVRRRVPEGGRGEGMEWRCAETRTAPRIETTLLTARSSAALPRPLRTVQFCPVSQRVSQILLHALFFFSGAAALGYQLVWSKMFSTGLGHETPAVLAIIAAFMGGMALGAAVIDRFIPRSARAGLWLGGLELTIGAWAMLVSFLIPSANDFALRLIGLAPGGFQHWMIAFTMPALVLLPATAAMGAMLPAMEKFLSALAPQNESVGCVYAANTFGAVSGTLLAPFVLMPALGFSRSCWVLAIVNGGVSVMALGLARAQRAVSLPMNRSAGLEPASCAPTPQAGWKPAFHPGSGAQSANNRSWILSMKVLPVANRQHMMGAGRFDSRAKRLESKFLSIRPPCWLESSPA